MPNSDPPRPAAAQLRKRALAALKARPQQPADTPAASQAEMQQLLHELQVHQVELELQNEELRRTQLELDAARQRWFELFDLAPVGYCTTSPGGKILLINLAAAHLLGQPRSRLPERRLSEFIEPEDQRSFQSLLARLTGTGDPQSCELRLARQGAAPRWVQVSATPAEDAEGQQTLRIVMIDVTVRRKAEAAEAALHLAEQAQRSRSEFLSRVSHEFRTPINAILGFSHLMMRSADEGLSDRARHQLQHIHDAGSHLLRMVSDLLDITRISSGQMALQITRVELVQLLRTAISELEPQAREAGVSCALEPPQAPGPDAVVKADATRLRQVMHNLLGNAIKYNRPGGRVTVRLSNLGEYRRVHIVDTGLGLSPAQQAALFQPFNRLGREAEGIEGTGLGLVIARDLVQAMGGRLGVVSEPGQGSEFRVDLVADGDAVSVEPGRAATATASAAPDPIASAPQVRPEVSGRLLCVEDNAPSRALLRSILDLRPGIALTLAATGAEGIAAARRSWPDLLILDQRLPDMPGLNVLKVLRQLNPHLPLRCIVVSAETSADGIGHARRAGADEYLAKPFDLDRLLAMIDRLMPPPPRGAAPAPPQG